MNIDRRQLALPVLAIGILGVVPAYAGADEDAVKKNVEAFRAAQFAMPRHWKVSVRRSLVTATPMGELRTRPLLLPMPPTENRNSCPSPTTI
jgi:hypothetical protein